MKMEETFVSVNESPCQQNSSAQSICIAGMHWSQEAVADVRIYKMVVVLFTRLSNVYP